MCTVSTYLNRLGTVQMKVQTCATIMTLCQIQMNQRAIVHKHTFENKPSGLNVLTTIRSPGLLVYDWGNFLIKRYKIMILNLRWHLPKREGLYEKKLGMEVQTLPGNFSLGYPLWVMSSSNCGVRHSVKVCFSIDLPFKSSLLQFFLLKSKSCKLHVLTLFFSSLQTIPINTQLIGNEKQHRAPSKGGQNPLENCHLIWSCVVHFWGVLNNAFLFVRTEVFLEEYVCNLLNCRNNFWKETEEMQLVYKFKHDDWSQIILWFRTTLKDILMQSFVHLWTIRAISKSGQLNI